MINHIINIIIVLEIIVFILKFIIPRSQVKGAYEGVINIIMFTGIIIISISIAGEYDIDLSSLEDIFKGNDVKMASFDEYIKIYRQLISQALE